MPTSFKKIITPKTLKNSCAALRRQGRTIVFTNGCFDILHAGHVRYLEAAKRDDRRVLIVGLNSDRSVRAQDKGAGRPIIPQGQRARLLAALACVDFVVIFNEPTPEQLVAFLQPDILVKGADWKGKKVAGTSAVKARVGRVEFITYVKGLSTTNIIEKIRKQCAR